MRIAVVGIGVVGLSTALMLTRSGTHAITIFFAEDLSATCSSRSGAVFTPFGGPENVPLLAASLREFTRLALDHPDSGVRLGRALEYGHAGVPPIPPWASLIPGGPRILGPVGTLAGAYELDVPMMDMTIYLPWLRAAAEHSGITLIQRRIDSLPALFAEGFDAVVNCSGLGARTLTPDPGVVPMRGQVLHVRNTLGLTDALAAHDGAVTYIYPFPNHIVLGGTYEPDVESETTEPHTLDAIRLRCEALLRAAGDSRWARLAEAPIRAVVGLRPARLLAEGVETIRLEREPLAADPTHILIHNYGHGRAGVTLSWGCAERVLQLLAD
ncbi:FAD-dependent oxidoreductase [soil metagenome]